MEALPDSPPQLPNLRGPGSALCNQVMARLPLPGVVPLTLARILSLVGRHAVVEEGFYRNVTK